MSHWEFDYGLLTKLPRTIFTNNFFAQFVQTQKSYPISFDKIIILTWILFTKLHFSNKLNSYRTYSLQNVICVAANLVKNYKLINFSPDPSKAT